METVVIVIHLMVVVAMIGLVLLQKSDGGALGIGGGGGGGFMTGRGAANVLTRATAIAAAAFFVTSIGLTVLARQSSTPGSIFDSAPAQQQDGQPASGGGVLPLLPQAPQPQVPQPPQPN